MRLFKVERSLIEGVAGDDVSTLAFRVRAILVTLLQVQPRTAMVSSCSMREREWVCVVAPFG